MDENQRRIVGNKQILFKGYIEGVPKESDMELKLGNEIKLEAPKGSGAFLVKNLYLSCDPYMRGRMRDFHGSYIPPFVPGSVRLLNPLKVLILSHDVVWWFSFAVLGVCFRYHWKLSHFVEEDVKSWFCVLLL